MNKTQLNKTIDFYNKQAKTYAENIEDRVSHKEIEMFCNHLTKGDKVLDVGCAAGLDSRVLTEKGFSVVGIDISDGLLAEARRRSSDIQFKKMDMMKLNFPENHFDGIWALASLLHLPTTKDVKKALKEFHRVLKKKGVLFILVKKRAEGYRENSLSARYEVVFH